MKSIQIKNSYNIWKPSRQRAYANIEARLQYGRYSANGYLNRSWKSIYIEWWLHNIGYYITLPFCKSKWIRNINLRCKDVDLGEWK